MSPSHPNGAVAQARMSLDAAADGERRLREALTYGRVAPYLILWGLFWATGFVGSQLAPERSGTVWALVTVLGWIGTGALALRQRRAYREPGFGPGARVTLCALGLSAYAGLWAFVLLMQHPNSSGIYAGTVTGFAYLVGGLWRGPLLVGLGFGVTAVFLLGFLVPPPWFLLYAGLGGGGGLIAAGLLLAQRDPT